MSRMGAFQAEGTARARAFKQVHVLLGGLEEHWEAPCERLSEQGGVIEQEVVQKPGA